MLENKMSTNEITTSIADGCRRVGVSRATFYRQAAQGRIPILKLGTRSLVRLSDLQRLVDELPTLRQSQEAPNAPSRGLQADPKTPSEKTGPDRC